MSWTIVTRSGRPDDGSAIQYYRWAEVSTKVEVFTAFRGREPDPSALLRHNGLVAAK